MIYGLNDLLGDLGGVMNVLLAVFGIIFYPMSKHLYYVNSIKKLFLARTRELEIFQKREGKQIGQSDSKILKYLNEENYPCQYDEAILKELRMHRLIKLSVKDNLLLFLNNNLFCFRYCPWRKRVKLQKLYNEG